MGSFKDFLNEADATDESQDVGAESETPEEEATESPEADNDGEELSESDIEEMVDQMLDDTNEEIKIGNLTYMPSHVLKNVDEVAYREVSNELLDSMIEDGTIEERDGKYFRV